MGRATFSQPVHDGNLLPTIYSPNKEFSRHYSMRSNAVTLARLMRITALLLIPVLLGNNLAYAAKKPIDAAQIKAKVEARGVGQGVRVTLADKTEQKGLIVSIGEQSFALKPRNAAQPVDVSYASVTAVHADKLSTGQKVAIIAVIAGAAIGITIAVLVHSFDKSFSKI